MVDTNGNFVLETCVLGGLCDARRPTTEPAVVEGAPPVPMIVRDLVIPIDGAAADRAPPRVTVYPAPGAERSYADVVVKASFSEPVAGVDARRFTLADAKGGLVPASVSEIGPGTFGLFPDRVLLQPGARYTARLAAGACDAAGNCLRDDVSWSFTVAADPDRATGDTGVPAGFAVPPRGAATSSSSTTKRMPPIAKGRRHVHR